jgi:hypothetical protein
MYHRSGRRNRKVLKRGEAARTPIGSISGLPLHITPMDIGVPTFLNALRLEPQGYYMIWNGAGKSGLP